MRLILSFPTTPLNCENFIRTTMLDEKLKMPYPSGSFRISLKNHVEAKVAQEKKFSRAEGNTMVKTKRLCFLLAQHVNQSPSNLKSLQNADEPSWKTDLFCSNRIYCAAFFFFNYKIIANDPAEVISSPALVCDSSCRQWLFNQKNKNTANRHILCRKYKCYIYRQERLYRTSKIGSPDEEQPAGSLLLTRVAATQTSRSMKPRCPARPVVKLQMGSR